jgi:hypothetical protein
MTGRWAELRCLALAAVAALALAATLPVAALLPRAAHAQEGFDSSVFDAPAASKSSFDINSWPVETALLFIVFLLATMLAFFAIYKYLLESARWWPLNAYGFCLFLITTIVTFAALLLFWEDLVLSAKGPPTFFSKYGLKIGLIALWLVVEAILLSVIRSPHTSSSQTKPAKA